MFAVDVPYVLVIWDTRNKAGGYANDIYKGSSCTLWKQSAATERARRADLGCKPTDAAARPTGGTSFLMFSVSPKHMSN